MKAVILAGGLGTRISEESHLKPKPMVEIGGKPILWHIMKIYSAHGIRDFIVCCGYKGYMIKEYFANYFMHSSDITFDLRNNELEIHEISSEPWRVTVVDTGENTQTGGRLLRVKKYLDKDEPFCFTYGDGVTDLNIKDTINFHKKNKLIATVTAVQPPGRFGKLNVKSKYVKRFNEKPKGDGEFINGGFFVLSPKVFKYLKNDKTVWEKDPLETLAKQGQLGAYKYNGFWQPMDTMRDKNLLEDLWATKKAPWKKW